MTAIHEVIAAREPIGIAEKHLQLTSWFWEMRVRFNIFFFRKNYWV